MGFGRSATRGLFLLILRIQLASRDTSDNPRFIWISRVSTSRGPISGTHGPRASGRERRGKENDETRREKRRRGEGDDGGWKCARGRVTRGETERKRKRERDREHAYIAYHETRLHGQVHLRTPIHPRRKRHGHYIHYDSSFRNNNEAGRGHVCLRSRILHLGHVVSHRATRWRLYEGTSVSAVTAE